MKIGILAVCMALGAAQLCTAQMPEGFRTEEVNRKTGDFQLDSIDLSSPMSYFLSRAWVCATGRARYWKDISTSKFSFASDAPDESVDSAYVNRVLGEQIDRVITYRDSAAAVVTHTEGEGFYLLNYCWLENGRWVNGGQGLAYDPDGAVNEAVAQLPVHLANLPRIAAIENLPQDVAPFADFLGGVSQSPEEFVLDMLGRYRLVVNGEYHRRKVSWDMLRRLLAMPGFARNTGHLFMELPSWCQPLMDEFMAGTEPDSELILRIFREEQPNGWWDRGEFDFISDLWRLNHSLPEENRIKVTLVDYQIPYSKVTEDQAEAEDRNTHMADVICSTLAESCDSRGALFLVGCAHAYKSGQAGIASAAHGREAQLTAGAQLSARLGSDNVFTIYQHSISSDNSGNHREQVRGGMFDRAFALAGNRPVGFRLAGSPFGAEPFDGIHEIKYNAATGSYADNYDGYLFLHPLEGEPQSTPLTEIFTEEFVAEMKRRAEVLDLSDARWMWFGRPASELTREYVVDALLGK